MARSHRRLRRASPIDDPPPPNVKLSSGGRAELLNHEATGSRPPSAAAPGSASRPTAHRNTHAIRAPQSHPTQFLPASRLTPWRHRPANAIAEDADRQDGIGHPESHLLAELSDGDIIDSRLV